MSSHSETSRRTIKDVTKGTAPGVWLTAYTATLARLIDPLVDVILVGDSLGMVVYGLPSTLGVTLDMMVAHGAAVVRSTARALVVVDLPFGAYQASPEQAFMAAARIMAETGAGAVKLEGGSEMAATVRFLAERGVPVCGHIGLTPQSVNALGGFRAQGREARDAERLKDDAAAIAEAGAFAIVAECVVEKVAREITAASPVPIIGIGASAECDGQVLVIDDLLGLFDEFRPRFVKRYATLGDEVRRAVESYAGEVRARTFPGAEHVFGGKGR